MARCKCARRLTFIQLTMKAVVLLTIPVCIAIGQIPSECGRKEKVKMIVVSIKPRNSESTSAPLPHYECYLEAEDWDAVVTSSRAYRTRNLAELPPYSAILMTDLNLPNNTAAYSVSLEATDDNAFGVFTCDASKNGRQNTTIMTIFLRSDGYLLPSDQRFTKTVSVGDIGVTINVTNLETVGIPSTDDGILDVRWRINGSNTIQGESGGAYLGLNYLRLISRPINSSDDGVYESHAFLMRNARHTLQRLIVRSCMNGRWGPPACTGICDICYNGGICDDETGTCICPPGFMGRHCLEGCGPNKFGYSCEFRCDYEGTGDCEGKQFCLVDPYGCTCNTGYRNIDCRTTCEAGTFGAGCLQYCHCKSGICDRFTGECDSGECEGGWSGTNCQIPDVCPAGYYGDQCTEKCLCADNISCDKVTGECSNRECSPGSAQQIGTEPCQECQNGFFGMSCLAECHCAWDACDKTTGECVGCCKPQWVDNLDVKCQVGLQSSSYIKVNEGTSTEIVCTAIGPNVDTDYWIQLSRDVFDLTDRLITTAFSDVSEGLLQTTYSISRVYYRDEFFCQLWGTNDLEHTFPLAWLNTSFSAYELPRLSDSPVLRGRTSVSVTIEWRAWNQDVDTGDPPIISYLTYYRKVGANQWNKGSTVFVDQLREFTASGLEFDTIYAFTVSVIREGDGGEGDMSPPLVVRTTCSGAVPVNVKAIVMELNQVNVSWQISSGAYPCLSRISSFIIYYNNGEETKAIGITEFHRKWYIVSNHLQSDLDYTFSVVSVFGDHLSTHSDPSPVVTLFSLHESTTEGKFDILVQNGNSLRVWIIALALIIVITYTVLLMWFVWKKCRERKTADNAGEAVSSVDRYNADKTSMQIAVSKERALSEENDGYNETPVSYEFTIAEEIPEYDTVA